MKRFVLTIMVVLSQCATAASQTAEKKVEPEERVFELTPVAPPTPALKYQLLFDNAVDRRPGNAAILYLQSVLIMGADVKTKAEQALDAFDANDMDGFNRLADSLQASDLFDELDLAGRREDCDWQPPIRERGVRTFMPHLMPLRSGVAKVVRVRALRQIGQGKVDDALTTMRLGYELSNKIGEEPVLVSALVSLAITSTMNDCLARAMSRPESPNLYWALAEFPNRRAVFRRAYDGERRFLFTSVPSLIKWNAGDELSADEWQAALDYIVAAVGASDDLGKPLDPVKGATAENLRQARRDYAAAHRLSADEVEKLAAIVVLGELYVRQYEIVGDQFYMLRGMPWPVVLSKSRQFDAEYAELRNEQPANPLLHILPQLAHVSWIFARVDRELAALTAVEAIRSYAAAHDGKLPARLEDITDTPVPENPATSQPFEYHVDGGAATLADLQSEVPLTYTVRIRK